MIRKNEEIRHFAKSNSVYLWQIADALQISPETLNKRLRHELPDSEKERYMNIITELAKQKGE